MPHRIVVVRPKGTSQFPRYELSDQNGQAWTGYVWSGPGQRSLLYVDLDLASVDCAWLQRQEAILKSRRMSASVAIDIECFGDTEIDPHLLKEWLMAKLRLEIDFSSGSGPTPDSIVLSEINWQAFQNQKEEKR